VKAGVKYAFGVTGSGASYELIHSLVGKRVPYFPVGHEAAAALMAGGCSRSGQAEAVAISIKGPGLVNLLPGIASNYFENRPAITISEAYSPNEGVRKHKRLDQISLVRPVAKAIVGSSTNVETIREQLQHATSEVPGPMHIELQNESNKDSCFSKGEEQREEVGANDINEALQIIRRSHRPAVVLGSVAVRCLTHLPWDKLTLPVLTTAAAKGCVDERLAFAGGVVTGEINELSPERVILHSADIVVGIGLRGTEMVNPTLGFVPLLNFDIFNGTLHEGFSNQKLLVTSHFVRLIEDVFDALSSKQWGEKVLRKYWQEVENELFARPWHPAIVLREVQSLFDDNSILVVDTGLFCTIAEIVWKAQSPNGFCGSSNGRFMGTAIPTAIGVAVSSRPQRVICLFGDGGIKPYLGEIALAVKEKLPILFVAMIDGCYGSIAAKVESRYSYLKPVDQSFSNWSGVAQELGCYATLADNLQVVTSVLKESKHVEGPLFIEARFDKNFYRHMTRRLR
jgi:acetolactate synthase-1/2/3 large subunit